MHCNYSKALFTVPTELYKAIRKNLNSVSSEQVVGEKIYFVISDDPHTPGDPIEEAHQLVGASPAIVS